MQNGAGKSVYDWKPNKKYFEGNIQKEEEEYLSQRKRRGKDGVNVVIALLENTD